MESGQDSDGTDDNFGPHCRNCHSGASACDQCHANANSAYTPVVDAEVAGKSNYTPQANVRTSAVTGAVSGQCIDGGFSFPHRTLGANMLKDELYGVDFDGQPVAAGVARTATNVGTPTARYNFAEPSLNASSVIEAVRTDSGTIANAKAENLDSVCIDCHGDATYYNDDLPKELLLKGLP